jgi:hypothetical protein
MKGLPKPILEGIIDHIDLDTFGQMLLMTRNFNYKVVDVLRREFKQVNQDGTCFRNIKYQTEKICLEAIDKYSSNIYHVKNQTETICIRAVKGNPLCLKYVRNKTYRICKEAVTRDLGSLKYVKKDRVKLFIMTNIETIIMLPIILLMSFYFGGDIFLICILLVLLSITAVEGTKTIN